METIMSNGEYYDIDEDVCPSLPSGLFAILIII